MSADPEMLLAADWLIEAYGGRWVNHLSPPGGHAVPTARREPDVVGGNALDVDGHVKWRVWDETKIRYDTGGGEFVR